MFITLEELADHLPNLTEVLDEGCVQLPPDIKAEYERIEATLTRKIASMMFKGGMKLMGTMVQTLLAHPDHPYGWEPLFEGEYTVGYWELPVGDHPELLTKEKWRGENEDDAAYETARYKFNYNVLDFFQTGYNLFDMRQASRRAWRLGQMWDCFVYYQYHADTMQHRAMELTSRKLEAALQLEGSFSENGLAALSSDSSTQMALCKSLSDRIDSEDIQRKWPKINAKAKQKPAPETEEQPEEEVVPDSEPTAVDADELYVEPEGMPPGVFVMTNSKNIEYLCRVHRSVTMPQPYIQATPLDVTPVPPPITITVDEVRRDGWKLDIDRINDDTLIELHRDGFDFTEAGTPEGVRDVGKKHKVVGEVPFETGVPEPKIKSPLDRHTMEKQMVAETIISYGFDSWFDDEPANTDESDSLFEDYDTGAIDDLFAEPAPPAAKPEPKKTKRAAAAELFDDWFDQEPEKAADDEWDF